MGIWCSVRKRHQGSWTLLPELAAYLTESFLASDFTSGCLFFGLSLFIQAVAPSGQAPAQHGACAAQDDRGF